ncbi:MAG TPA: T9SS type A sorting domain-containing protein [Rhodothermales bacterium]|nr:T9SS type A sorting domain-containing protein [Rhodothermales bacterium]
MSCLAPASSPGQSTRKSSRFDSERAALREKILAEKGSDYLSKGVGACQLGDASAILDVNGVNARLYNTGGLFWKGAGPHYNVPRTTKGNAIFAHGIWIGGLIDGELHASMSNYGPWEFWPGPLDDSGNPPADCSTYDRMYSVKRADIEAYEEGGGLTDDLVDWPYDLGAPVIDGDGNPDNYNLAAGDRPAIKGDQTIWWIMNDAGNSHDWSLTRPMQIEVRVTAYAFNHPRRLANTTFYQYELTNRGSKSIEKTWFGTWVDPDLGDAGDDYVGSDSTLGLAIVYNGDDFDGGSDGYGDRPPALAFQFVQGPVAPVDGIDNDHDGEIDEAGERRSMTRFVNHQGNGTVQGNPHSGDDAYRYLQGLWRNDDPITFGGSGRSFSEERAFFMFPDDPPAYWSEENVDDHGSRNTPADRNFIASTGPFTLGPGETEQITYAVVFSQGRDRLDSYYVLEEDARYIQLAFDAGFQAPAPPDPPRISATSLDGTIVLKWENDPQSNNYLDAFEVDDPFLAKSGATDSTYTFEGYNVYRFASATDTEGERIATFDRVNGVKRVFDAVKVDSQTGTEITGMVADGVDSGVEHSLTIEDVTNYKTYYFGVEAYAYNGESSPKVLTSAVSRISVEPSSPVARTGGTTVVDGVLGSILTVENGGIVREGRGGGTLVAAVDDPLAVTGHTYRVEFFESSVVQPGEAGLTPTSYSVVDQTTGELKLDGAAAEQALGRTTPLSEHVVQIDGLSLSLSAPEPGPVDIDGSGLWAFIQVQGGDGLTPDACDAGAASTFGCAQVGGNWVYGSFNGRGDWIMYHLGAGPEAVIGAFAPNDFEIRATDEGSYGYFLFSSGNAIWVPFETWDIGPTGPFGLNDPSDDVRMIPILFADGGGECSFGFGEADDPFGLGWPLTDRIYAYYAVNDDYMAWEAAIRPLIEAHPGGCPTSPETDGPAELIDLTRGRPIQRIVFMMDPTSPEYRAEFIPVGNVVRFLTTKPFIPGDRFWIHTAGFEPTTNDLETATAALDLIGIVPNPYKGISDYELTTIRDAVRFTNLPDVATIRIYNLAGTLMRQLEKTPSTTGLEWDLTNDDGFHIASGMYLVHVEVLGVGERVLKFGMVKKRR